jgi:hypothetical protein
MNAMRNPRLILVVVLDIWNEGAADFERFERHAVAIKSRSEGRIERVIRLEQEIAGDSFREVHIVSFPNRAALDAYRRDPELAALKRACVTGQL